MHIRSVFFLHNPKAGGSSLRVLFGKLFAAEATAPIFSNAPNDHRANSSSLQQHRGYAFYAGHYGYDAYERLNNGHLLITNFRDPVERLVSLYRFWRNSVSRADLANVDPKDAEIVLLSHELDFPTFIRSENPDLRLYISNFHFRQLHRSAWEPPTGLRPWHVRRVKRRISRMPWFYIAELPHISTLLLRKTFPELPSAPLPHDNSSQGERSLPTPADIEHIVALNRLDYEIYYHAVQEQRERLRLVRDA